MKSVVYQNRNQKCIVIQNFVSSVILQQQYNKNISLFQYSLIINNELYGGLDGISILFIFLINKQKPIIMQKSINNNNIFKQLLLLVNILSILVFYKLNIQLFYICFEIIQVPLYFLLGFYGSRNYKSLAQNLLVIYTIFGGLLKLISLSLIYYIIGSFDYTIFYKTILLSNIELIIFIGLIITFFIKTPVFGLHNWQPLAHVESSGVVSVILAGIILKFAGYGIIRFILPNFEYSIEYFNSILILILVISILYTSLSAIYLYDQKKLIAYSSIIHMSISTIGILNNNLLGIIGSILYGISHGLISSGLFIIISLIYDRHHSRNIYYYKGLKLIYPLIIILLFIFTLSNISFPLTLGFISELLIFISSLEHSLYLLLVICPVILLLPYYFIWFYQKISKGKISNYICHIKSDLNIKELHLLLPLLILNTIFGIKPKILINILITSLTI